MIVVGSVVRFDPLEIFSPTLTVEEGFNFVVRRKDGRGGPQFRSHVRDHVAVHDRQGVQPGTVILDNPAHRSIDVVAAKHLENDVLGAAPIGKLTG